MKKRATAVEQMAEANVNTKVPVSLRRASAPSVAELMGFAWEPAPNAFKPKNEDENLVSRAFVNIAEQIIDRQVRWQPGQSGRWEVTDVHGTPVIEFKDFPEGTVLDMQSVNGQDAKMGLKAAAYAFSDMAMNWTAWKLHETGRDDLGEIANGWWSAIKRRIYHSRDLTKDDQRKIRWYND